MALSAAEIEKHRNREVSDEEFEEHKWEVALHNERDAILGRKGTTQEKDPKADARRVEEIGELLGGGKKRAKPRTAVRGKDAETREDAKDDE